MSIKSFIDGPAWSHDNLAVHPLIAAAAGKRAYLTMDEALAAQSFRVNKISKSGSVPELKVHNNLSRPVLLLDGEALVGAKVCQSRTKAHAQLRVGRSGKRAALRQQRSGQRYRAGVS